jgi:hypothetical protein
MATEPILTEFQNYTNQDILASQGITTVITPTGISAIDTNSIASTSRPVGQNTFGVDVIVPQEQETITPVSGQDFLNNTNQSFLAAQGIDTVQTPQGLQTIDTNSTDAYTVAGQNALGVDIIPQGEPTVPQEPTIYTGTDNPFNAGAGAISNPFGGGAGGGANMTTSPNASASTSPDDWRVRLTLARGATYLYKDPAAAADNHILSPLRKTNGIIFPYTPTVSISYAANYDTVDLTHTNYKIFQYRNSSVGDISISGEFTAQDTNEARYLLAVIHFLKSVTKMFYGKDASPVAGTPPPLCYLSGYGNLQFDNHPLVISNFSYSLPNDVDYIRASLPSNTGGQNLQAFSQSKKTTGGTGGGIVSTVLNKLFRLDTAGVPKGATAGAPNWNTTATESKDVTYVPTKMTIQLQCLPVVSRFDTSNIFSLSEYASGNLNKGSKRSDGGFGGFW